MIQKASEGAQELFNALRKVLPAFH